MKSIYSVLFVDNEIHMLNSLKRELQGENYFCFFAESANNALKIMKQEKINVIITDIKMPDIDGLALLREVKRLYPDVVRLLLSDCQDIENILPEINKIEILNFIPKPSKIDEKFKLLVHQAIKYYIFQNENSEKALLWVANC